MGTWIDKLNTTSVFFRFMTSEKMSNRSKKVVLSTSNDKFKVRTCLKKWFLPLRILRNYKGDLQFAVFFCAELGPGSLNVINLIILGAEQLCAFFLQNLP